MKLLPFKPCTLPKHVRVEILNREFPVKNLYFPCKGLQCSYFDYHRVSVQDSFLYSPCMWLILYVLLNETVAEGDAFDPHDFIGSPQEKQNNVLFQSIEIVADIGDVGQPNILVPLSYTKYIPTILKLYHPTDIKLGLFEFLDTSNCMIVR